MRDHPPVLAVHAGAHPATSRDLRRWIHANRQALLGLGVISAAPALTWPPSSADIAEINTAAGDIARGLAPQVAGAGTTVLLTMPDLPGSDADLLAGRFFPDAGARATALRLGLGRPVERVTLVVRPYDEMYRAAWRHAAIEGTAPEFADIANSIRMDQHGWPEIAEAMAEILGSGEITVMTAPVDGTAIAASLLPDADLSAMIPVEPSFEVTDSAVAMIRRLAASGTRFAPGQRERLVAFHARQPQITDIDPGFPALMLSDLRGRYVADLAVLSRTPGVTFVGDPSAGLAQTAMRRTAT